MEFVLFIYVFFEFLCGPAYELENAIMFIFLFALLHYIGMVGERICKCEKSLLRIVIINVTSISMLCMQIEIKEPISGYLFHFIEVDKSEVSYTNSD
jgi:hypothetical protein